MLPILQWLCETQSSTMPPPPPLSISLSLFLSHSLSLSLSHTHTSREITHLWATSKEPAGRVRLYSSLILSTFLFFFFSSSIAVFFIAKPSSIVVFVVQTKWTFNQEGRGGRGHKSLIGVSNGIGRPQRDTLRFSEYRIPYARCRVQFVWYQNCSWPTTSSTTRSKHKLTDS